MRAVTRWSELHSVLPQGPRGGRAVVGILHTLRMSKGRFVNSAAPEVEVLVKINKVNRSERGSCVSTKRTGNWERGLVPS
jgi:hypothetical protein